MTKMYKFIKGGWGMKQRSSIKQNTSRGNFRWGVLTVSLMLAFCIGAGLSGEAVAKDPSKGEQQAEIRKMAKETLSRLYKEQPSAREVVGKSAGYAVFSNFGMKIFLFGSGMGKGVVINKKNNNETFMKMIEAQAGLGLGAKKFKQVWVFKSQKALNDFVNSGWEFGGQATAAAKAGEKGGDLAGAIAVDVDILLYQLTDDGLAAEITAKGTKYYKDDDLN
jgi:lipid-binding SYLF domain-containing protein